MAAITCGNGAKHTHPTVADVKTCWANRYRDEGRLPNATSQPVERQSAAAVDAIPEGRYAIDTVHGLQFFQIEKPSEGPWAGRVFVTRLSGPNGIAVKNRKERAQILFGIVSAGVAEAMKRYGREIGRCGACGLRLTTEESREAGIGPVCARKRGW